MRGGFRKPSLNKRIAARTSIKRVVRQSLGVKAPKGAGWLTNPKKAAYNRVYNRVTVDPLTIAKQGMGGRSGAGVAATTCQGITCTVLILFLFGLGSIVHSCSNQPPPETFDQYVAKTEREEQATREAPPVMRVTAKELGEAYSRATGNPDLAKIKYEGKVLVVTGKVFLGFTSGTPHVVLINSNKGLSVEGWCTEKDISVIERLKEGQAITIKGRCDGSNGVEIILSDCVFYK